MGSRPNHKLHKGLAASLLGFIPGEEFLQQVTRGGTETPTPGLLGAADLVSPAEGLGCVPLSHSGAHSLSQG